MANRFSGGTSDKNESNKSGGYSIEKVVVYTEVLPLEGHGQTHIICDLDKTYLETNLESFVAMAKTALEDAPEKETVAGATETLKAGRWQRPEGKPASLHFVSASPPQIRSVIAAKLKLDGLQWNSDTYKNQVYNIRKRRIDLLRNHIAYKSYAIHRILQRLPRGGKVIFIGDNAEHDTFIYKGIDFFLSGHLNQDQYIRYIELGGKIDGLGDDLKDVLVPSGALEVAGIYIREVVDRPLAQLPPLTDSVVFFSSYYQVILNWMVRGLILAAPLWSLTRQFHNIYGLSRMVLVRDLDQAISLCSDSGVITAMTEVRNRLGVGRITKAVFPGGEAHQRLAKSQISLPGPDDLLELAETWIQGNPELGRT